LKTSPFSAQNNFDALDATGYYFPGYPKVPSDDTIRGLKKKAYVNGVVLSSTGVRNDFTLPDGAARKKEVQLVKDWIEVAAKLGVPVIRVSPAPRFPRDTPPTASSSGWSPIFRSAPHMANNSA
jgi:sugar phosphate isomerase/epimerase